MRLLIKNTKLYRIVFIQKASLESAWWPFQTVSWYRLKTTGTFIWWTSLGAPPRGRTNWLTTRRASGSTTAWCGRTWTGTGTWTYSPVGPGNLSSPSSVSWWSIIQLFCRSYTISISFFIFLMLFFYSNFMISSIVIDFDMDTEDAKILIRIH